MQYVNGYSAKPTFPLWTNGNPARSSIFFFLSRTPFALVSFSRWGGVGEVREDASPNSSVFFLFFVCYLLRSLAFSKRRDFGESPRVCLLTRRVGSSSSQKKKKNCVPAFFACPPLPFLPAREIRFGPSDGGLNEDVWLTDRKRSVGGGTAFDEVGPRPALHFTFPPPSLFFFSESCNYFPLIPLFYSQKVGQSREQLSWEACDSGRKETRAYGIA